MSIREALGLPATDDKRGREAWQEVGKWLRTEWIENEQEKARQRRMMRRRRLWQSDGLEYINQIIDSLFKDPKVRELRKAAAKHAGFDNVLRHVIGLLSQVYAQKAMRSLGQADVTPYVDLQRRTRQDELMRRANAYANLFNDFWLGFRVRRGPMRDDGTDDANGRRPAIDVVSPDRFWAIPHPDDPEDLLAMVFRKEQLGLKREDVPYYTVMTAREFFDLDKNAHIIEQSIEDNPFERLPGMLVHREPPDGSLLDSTSGEDLVDAHLMAWLQHTMLVKESKSVSKQTALSGDLTTTASGQSQETETDLQLGDGVTVQSIDRGVDLDQFMRTADHIIERAAANYGIPPAVLRHEGATSGHEIKLRRIPLMERRAEQIVVFREVEREFAEIQAMVLDREMPSLAFDAKQFSVDFGEIEVPLSEMEALTVFEKERQLLVTSTVEFLKKRNPDLKTDDAAFEELNRNINQELQRNLAMRTLQMVNGSPVQGIDDARTPQENGAQAQADDDEPEELPN